VDGWPIHKQRRRTFVDQSSNKDSSFQFVFDDTHRRLSSRDRTRSSPRPARHEKLSQSTRPPPKKKKKKKNLRPPPHISTTFYPLDHKKKKKKKTVSSQSNRPPIPSIIPSAYSTSPSNPVVQSPTPTNVLRSPCICKNRRSHDFKTRGDLRARGSLRASLIPLSIAISPYPTFHPYSLYAKLGDHTTLKLVVTCVLAGACVPP
jgi:hypothetical protein